MKRSIVYTSLFLATVAVFSTDAHAQRLTTKIETARQAAQANASFVVNVNTATAQQLAYLPGVGPKLAEAIIGARPIADSAALDNVKGIGPKKLAAMLPCVTFEGETTATAKIAKDGAK